MAIVVESVATTTPSAVSSSGGNINITITKPTGVAVGDLLVCHLVTQFNSSSYTTNKPSGWTQLRWDVNASPEVSAIIFWKVATQTEVDATNFTFGVVSGGTFHIGGGIARISGAGTTNPIESSNGSTATNTANPSFGNAVTPTIADSLLLFFATTGNTSATLVSNYAIATSNPTWTEKWDVQGGNPIFGTALASATRTQTTSTGNSSCSGGGAGTDWVGQLLVIPPYVPSGPSNVKTFQGVTKANTKTLQGVAMASIKSSQGVV
jgi:hypothetical protein